MRKPRALFLINIRRLAIITIFIALLYLFVRIALYIATSQLGYVFYSKSLGINIKKTIYYLDIFIAVMSIFSTSLYFKKKIIPFILMIIFVLLLPFHFLFRWGIEDVKDLHNEYLDSHYLVQLLDAPVSTNDISLSAFVYKEEYPMMYKIVGRKIEVYSKLTNDDTITLFRENEYEVSEDGTYIKYGKFTIPIK